MTSVSTNSNIPPEVLSSVQEKIQLLEAALIAKDPELRTHLQAIHKTLLTYPETVALLRDEEIGTTIRAMEAYTNTKIVEDKVKGTGGSRKQKVNLDMF